MQQLFNNVSQNVFADFLAFYFAGTDLAKGFGAFGTKKCITEHSYEKVTSRSIQSALQSVLTAERFLLEKVCEECTLLSSISERSFGQSFNRVCSEGGNLAIIVPITDGLGTLRPLDQPSSREISPTLLHGCSRTHVTPLPRAASQEEPIDHISYAHT